MALVSDAESAVSAEPGDGGFDDPVVAAEPGRGLDADSGDLVADAPLVQRAVAVGDVVGLRGFPATRAAPGSDLRDVLDQRFEGLRVVRVRTRDPECEWQSGEVGQDVRSRQPRRAGRVPPGGASPTESLGPFVGFLLVTEFRLTKEMSRYRNDEASPR